MMFPATVPFWAWVMTIGVVAILALRLQARHENEIRVRQLEQCASLLDVHADSMARFLGSDAAPVSLKRLLIQCSDALQDEATALSLEQNLFASPPVEDHDDITAAVRDLDHRNPELAEDFQTAIRTLVAASILRWPSTASMIDTVWPRIVTNPQREISAVIATTRKISSAAFGLRPATT